MNEFRAEIRAWLEQNCPPSLRTPEARSERTWGGRRGTFASEDARVWFERAVAAGYTVPTWPKKYGGAGLTEEQGDIFEQEMRAMGCRPPLHSLGVWLLSPVLFEYATEEQKLEHLLPIARGERRWCQGYSEPAAGSDLAGLQTRAVRDGDHYVVNGHKVWTSHANKADWMFCLVRTDPDAPKRNGISFLLIDMDTPGISVSPIKLISGTSPFCETQFEDVRVPAENLVGPLGGGWTIAKKLLAHERTLISRMRDKAPEQTETLEAMALRCLGATETGAIADPLLRDQVIQANLDFLCNRLTMQRAKESAEAGHGPGAASSMFKLYGTELNQRRKQLQVELSGYAGIGWDEHNYSEAEREIAHDWLRSRANTIEGGTSEIQMNIIAKRVLGLPD